MRVRLNDTIWDKERIQKLIDTNDAAVSRALMVIYANQTEGEKMQGQTVERNNVGFTGRDAEFLTDIAQKWKHYGRWASQKQLNAVRRCIRKYWRQLLLDMVENKGAEQIKGRLPKEPVPDQQPDLVLEAEHQTQPSLMGSW